MKERKTLITIILLIASFVLFANITIVAPILKFIKISYSVSEKYYAIILTSFPIVAFFSNIIVGPFIDKHGRKFMIVVGALIVSFMFLATAFSTNVNLFILFRALTGLFIPMMGASIFTYVIDYFPIKDRLKVMGRVMSANFIAQVIAIPIGILAAGYFTWHYVFYLLAVLSFIVFFMTIFFVPNPQIELNHEKITLTTYKKKFLTFSADTNLLIAIIVYFLIGFGASVLVGMYPTWLFKTFFSIKDKAHGVKEISTLFLLTGIFGWIGSMYAGSIINKCKNKIRYLVIITLIAGIMYISLPFLNKLFYIQIIVFVLITFIGALRNPIIQGLIPQFVIAKERGSLQGLMNAVFQLSSATGLYLSASLYLMDESFLLNSLIVSLILISAGIALIFVKIKIVNEQPVKS